MHRNGTGLETFGERFSLEELHHEKRHALDLADVVDGGILRVGYPGDRRRLMLNRSSCRLVGVRDDVRILTATDRPSCESGLDRPRPCFRRRSARGL